MKNPSMPNVHLNKTKFFMYKRIKVEVWLSALYRGTNFHSFPT
jgi:hypothetical protein